MTTDYRGTMNVVTDQPADDVLAKALSVIDAHMIVVNHRTYRAAAGIVTVQVRFTGQNVAEAFQIMEDAGRASGQPFDAVTVDQMGSWGWERVHQRSSAI